MVAPRIYFLAFVFLLFSCAGKRKHQEKIPDRPNILLCIADDAAWPHMGAYGTKWVHTPGFDRVAEEGLLFTRAYTPNAKCAPSRACIITGRNSWQLEAAANHWCYFPEKFKTYAEVLSENGYFTGFTGKGWAPGIATTKEGEKRFLVGEPWQKIKTTPPTTGIANTDYAANFEAFLENKPGGKPFCFWYGGFEPHRKYEYGSGIRLGNKRIGDVQDVYHYWPDVDSVRTDMLDYAFEIEYFDDHLIRMLTILEEKGMLDNTVVIVTGDNGMPFPRCKGQEYEHSNHMPLAIMWKNGINKPGRVIDDYISFIDFAPTFLEIAGIDPSVSGMQQVTGKSLIPVFTSSRAGTVDKSRDHVLIGKERHDVGRPRDEGYPIRGIIKNGFLYIRNFKPDRWPAGNPETGYLNCDGSPVKTVILNRHRKDTADMYWKYSFGKRPAEELYDLYSDRECIQNLAGDPAYEEVKNILREQLFEELKEQNDPRMIDNGDIFDRYPYADTRDTAFYERYMRGENIPAGWVNPGDFEKNPL